MESSDTRTIIAIDPGSDKCGIAVLAMTGIIIFRRTAARSDIEQILRELHLRYEPEKYSVGDGTNSAMISKMVEKISGVKPDMIPERDSTLEGRSLAWDVNPPGGIFRILPRIFWPLPKDIDSWAAVVIGRRSLQQLTPK